MRETMHMLARDSYFEGFFEALDSIRMAISIVVNASAGMSDAQHLGILGNMSSSTFLGHVGPRVDLRVFRPSERIEKGAVWCQGRF